HRGGQIIGDFVAMMTGAAEIEAGVGMVGGGAIATPLTSGLSLGVSALGVGAVSHGGTVVLTGAWNASAGIKGLADYMSKKTHGTMGNNRKKNEEVTSLVKKYKLN